MSNNKSDSWAKTGVIAGVIGALAAVIFGVAQSGSTGRPSNQGETGPQVATPTISTTLGQSAGGAHSEQSAIVASNLAQAPRGLGDVVSSVSCGNFGWYNMGPAKIAGTERSDAFPISCFNSGEKASVDFVVPSGANHLSGIVGIDDITENPDSSATYTVLDPAGRPLAPSTTVAYGHDAAVDISLNGAVRVRLQVSFTMARSGLVRACWADMQFTF